MTPPKNSKKKPSGNPRPKPNPAPRTEVARGASKPAPGTPPAVLPFLDGSALPPVPAAPRRTRGGIRISTAHFFDAVIRSRMETACRDPLTPLKDVLAIGDLYARLGLGFVGTNEIDPADVAKLPAPVIQVLDPNAPLPDGKPDPDGVEGHAP